MTNNRMLTLGLILVLTVAVGGCSGANKEAAGDMTQMEQMLQEKNDQIAQLNSDLENRDETVERLQGEVVSAVEARDAAYTEMEYTVKQDDANGGSSLLPPASPGECYTRVFVPAQYETVDEQVLHREQTSKVAVVPAEYEWVEEKVMTREASKRLEAVPAEYEWQEEKVLVKEAHTVWKKGRGLVEKVNESTGEIMCLVEVPPRYETVRKQVQVKPASTHEVVIPAEYETVKVKRMVKAAQETRTEIPAEYQTLTRMVKVSEGYMEWRQVLCETNMGNANVQSIQRALMAAGHNPGPIDGIIGVQTLAAVDSYQRAKGLAVGGLTYETIKSLGLSLN